MGTNKGLLIKKLKARLKQEKDDVFDRRLCAGGEGFLKGESWYTDAQRMLVSASVDGEEFPERTRMLDWVLRNIQQSYPLKVSNINDDDRFPAYRFLKTMVEPSSKYFSAGSEDLTVVEYIAIKHDTSFPSPDNGFDWEMYHEGADLYRYHKRDAIGHLMDAFANRGTVRNPVVGCFLDSDDISKSMTPSRLEYLSDLASSFDEDHEAPDVVEFVESLPGIDYPPSVRLVCDGHREFEELKKKYIPGYESHEGLWK